MWLRVKKLLPQNETYQHWVTLAYRSDGTILRKYEDIDIDGTKYGGTWKVAGKFSTAESIKDLRAALIADGWEVIEK